MDDRILFNISDYPLLVHYSMNEHYCMMSFVEFLKKEGFRSTEMVFDDEIKTYTWAMNERDFTVFLLKFGGNV